MSGLDNMKQRLDSRGGFLNGRNVKGKLNSFHAALNNSYQSEWITVNKGKENEQKVHCLINPSRLTEEFDKKVISVDFDKGITEGTVFYWDRTEKYWIVNLQQHTEEAYFRGDITRCDYQVDIDGEHYWVYLRGPIETDISWSQKHGIYFNNLNYSMLMHITKNKKTLDYFSRFNVVKVSFSYIDENGEKQEEWHRWQVAATDKYSNNNIIEVYLNEYADNPIEEDKVKEEEKKFSPEEAYIDGPQFINPYDENIVYTIKNSIGGRFIVNSNKVKIVESNDNSLTLNVLTGKSAKFDIIYRKPEEDDVVLNVTIKSL